MPSQDRRSPRRHVALAATAAGLFACLAGGAAADEARQAEQPG